MFLFNLLEGEATGGSSNPMMFIILGVVIIGMIVMSVINNKKRKKQAEEDQKQKDKLCKGTKIITIGGIWGTVVSVNNEENTFVMESEGSLIKFDKRAIYNMILPENIVEEPKQETKEEVKEEA